MKQAMLKSMLFDLDGTLVNLESLHYKAHACTLHRHGVTLTPSLYKAQVVGRRNREMLSWFFPSWSTADKERYSTDKEAHYRSLIRDVSATQGTSRLLEWATSQSITSALVTNATRANVDLLLVRIGLSEAFSIQVLGEELPRTKPDPLPYRVALTRLGCTADEAIVFEDSEPGIRAGKAAGVFTVGITSSLSVTELTQHGADLAITDFDDPRLWRLLGSQTLGGARPEETLP